MQAMDRGIATPQRCAGVLLGMLLCGAACLAQLPPQTNKLMVGDVRIQNNRLVPTQQIMALLKTKPNTEYDPEVVREDVRTLFATRQFGNVEGVYRMEPDGRVTVCFLIRDYPNVVEDVKYLGGGSLSLDDLEKLTGVRKGEPLNPIRNKLGCQAIERRL